VTAVLDERWVLLGAALSLVGMVQYLRGMFRGEGEVQPNRVTWACWALAPLVAFAAELDEGVGLRSAMTFIVGFSPLVIFLASFANRAAYWRIGPFDTACGVLSVAAVAGWALTRSGVIAIVFAIVADAVAGVPTLVKTWRRPETEEPLIFLFAMLNGVIALLTIDRWTTAEAAFPLYIALIGLALTAIAYRGRWASAAQ
jgi:hypothetical protein